MTGVEKQMNKDEMEAYKKYDNKSYSLQPGMQGQKAFAEPRPRKSPLGLSQKVADLGASPNKLTAAEKEANLRKQEDRLAAYGFTHLQKGVGGSIDASIANFKAHPNGSVSQMAGSLNQPNFARGPGGVIAGQG